MMSIAGTQLPIHFDPIRAHRSYPVPDRYEFVPNRNADYVNVFDLAQGACIRRIQVAGRPDVTATTIDGRYLFVAGEHFAVIDLETFSVVRSLSGDGINAHYALNLFPDGKRMFLFNYDGSIAVLHNVDDPQRLAVEKVLRINAPAEPDASVGGKGHFTADGRRYINANWHADAVFSIDLADDYRVTTLIPTGFSRPDDLVMTAGERKGYTASYGREPELGAVQVFDVEEKRIVKTLKVGRCPAGMTMSPDSRYAYVTNVADGSFSAIDAQTDEVLYTASAEPQYRAAGIEGDYLDIEGVTVSADGRTLYAYAVNYGALVVFDGLSPAGVTEARFITGEH